MSEAAGMPRETIIRLTNALRRYAERSERIIDAHGARRGVHRSDLRALSFLMQREQEGVETTPSDLAKHLGISSPSATALVDRLTKQGHVARKRSTTDRRSVHVVATESAMAEGREIFMPIARESAQALAEFTDEELAIAERVLHAATSALIATLEPSDSSICNDQ